MTAPALLATHGFVSGGPKRLHLRLTRRGRIVLTTLASLPLLAALLAFAVFGGSAATATGGASQVTFSYVTVQAGQSLWSIAQGLDASGDPRDVIAELKSLNNLQTSSVQPGQRLAIPAEYAK